MSVSVAIQSDAHWNELRSRHLGGSEIAALFGEHPNLTRFELWHRKRGNVPSPDLSDNSRVFWGSVLEPAIAAGAAKLHGWTVRKIRRYMTHPTVRLGGSVDYEIIAHERGPGILEIKTADWLVAKRWENDEPPLSYLLQLQAYLGISGRAWGAVAVLIGGNDLRVFPYERRPAIITAIEREVAAFWQSIEEDRPPPPDFTQDLETIRALYGDSDGSVVDLTGSNRLVELCAAYTEASAAEKAASAAKEAAKAEALTLIGPAAKAIVGEYTITAGTVAAATVSYERKPYRNFRISQKGSKK